MTVHSAGRTAVPRNQLAMEDPAFERARRQVVEAHDELERGRRALSSQARELFADGWRGPAAGEYARAWAQWESGAGQLIGALPSLAAAMGAARVELVDADSAVAAQSSRLRARLER